MDKINNNTGTAVQDNKYKKVLKHFNLYFVMSMVVFAFSGKVLAICALYSVKQIESEMALDNVSQAYKYKRRAKVFLMIDLFLLALKLLIIVAIIIGMVLSYQEYIALLS